MRAVFLDRDGVINENLSTRVLQPSQLRYLPGSLAALARLARTDFRIVVVTNQSVIERGALTRTQLDAIHSTMVARVRSSGGRIDAVYVCPHRPDQGCRCRKPGTALLEQASIDLGIDLASSYVIGDAMSDINAARAAGCRPVLVRPGTGRFGPTQSMQLSNQLWVTRDLRHAVEVILAREPVRYAKAH